MEMGPVKLLFDTGPGTMRRLLEAGVEIFDLAYIFYSHFHPDHTGELVPLLFATKYPDGARRKAPLSLVAGKGFFEFFKALQTVYGEWIELEAGLLKLMEIDSRDRYTRRFDAFQLDTLPVDHREESIAYRITDPEGRSMVYSGDTDYTDNLIALAREADLFICESALPDDLKVKGHLSPSLAGRIAAQAGVKTLVLTHLYPECDQADIVAECRKTYQGPLIIAEDLLKIPV